MRVEMRKLFRLFALVACLGAATAWGAQVAAANTSSASEKTELKSGSKQHQHKGQRGQHYFGKIAKELGLSEQQKTQAKALHERLRGENKELFGALRTERRQLRSLIHSGTADEAAIRAQAAKVASVEADLAVKKAQGAKQFLALLTADQVAKYQALQAKMESKRGGKFGHFGGCDERPMKDK